MPYLVVCPNCATKLKSPTPLAAGRVLNCPTCQGQFTLSEPAVPLDPTGRPAGPSPGQGKPATPPAPPPPARPPALGRLEPARPARRSPPADIPDAEILDDDDDRPAPRKPRDQEDDDRPRSRRRDPDDEDSDRARRRRGSRDDEEEADRPRARRGRDDEDDERLAPRRTRGDDSEDELDVPPPRRRRKKKSNKGLLIGLIAGAAALFLCATGGILLYFLDPFGWFGGASGEMLAWAPADAQAVIYADVEGLSRVSEAKEQLSMKGPDTGKYGLRNDDVSAVLGAGRTGGLGGDPDVLVVKLKSPADQNAIIAANGATSATANGKTYYRTRSGGGLYFPSSRIVVITQSESSLTARLGKDEGKVVISDDLRAVTKRGDGLAWVAASGQAAEQADFIGMIVGLANMFGPGGPGPGFGPGAPKTAKARSSLMAMRASGNTATIRFESTYDSADTARKLADDLQRALTQNKAKIEPDTSFDVSSSGATVTLRVSGPVKKGKGAFPFGIGGP